KLRREPVNLETTVRHCLATLESQGRLREHRLALETLPIWVEGDPDRLEQVATNLIDNALKYTPSGGQIGVPIRAEGREAVFRVRDSGVGIDADLLPRLFDVFVQAQQTSHRPEGGLGLGLALVRRLVERHGGAVTATSHGPGRGSEFTVRLPLPPPHGGGGRVAAGPRGPRPAGGTRGLDRRD